jgi:methyl-accepting chemotaxis protein
MKKEEKTQDKDDQKLTISEVSPQVQDPVNDSGNASGAKTGFKGILNFVPKALRPVEKSKKKSGKIIVKLIGAFIIPILLCAALGILCYITAKDALLNKYEASSRDTISAMGMYSVNKFENIEGKALDFLNSDDVLQYTKNVMMENFVDAKTYADNCRKSLIALAVNNSSITNYFLFTPGAAPITSTSSINFTDTFYDEFKQGEIGQYFATNSSKKAAWFGSHESIDRIDEAAISPYGLTYIREFINGKGYLTIDISRKATDEILNKLDFGKGSISAIITPDGTETFHSESTITGPIFYKSDFYAKALEGKEEFSDYITYNGKRYLFLYSPIGKTGLSLSTLIPQDLLLNEVSKIRIITVLFTIAAVILLSLIGFIISSGISREVNSMSKSLGEIAQGNLSIRFTTKRNDEFRVLSKSLTNMLQNICMLIQDTKGFSSMVSHSADEVVTQSNTLSKAFSDITSAIEDVETGVVSQASDVESSFVKVTQFSEQITGVIKHTDKMGAIADSTLEITDQGKLMVGDLNTKSDATVQITRILAENIALVEEQSKNIGGIISTINEIAEQSNLLSLNASIEAARAGEAGRGFGVVAEEIRKLAEQSKNSSGEIKKLIKNIQETSANTAQSVKQAEENVASQSEALEKTIHVFAEISESVITLANGLKEIMKNMELVSNEKEEVLSSISNISAVSEEAAASTEEVAATINEQKNSIHKLTSEAEDLIRKTKDLQNSIQRFQI